MRGLLLIAALIAAAGTRAVDAAILRSASGLVQVRPSGSDRWTPAGRLPRALLSGDAVRTGFAAGATIGLEGGGTLEAGANTQLSVDEEARGGSAVNLLFGSARVSARGLGGGILEMRTPTATARARSEAAGWRAAVVGGGRVSFQVDEGLLGVEDLRGGSLRLRAGERVEIDLAGLHEPVAAPTPARARRDDFAESMRRELAFDAESDAAQRRVTDELRRADFESGRAQVDASGARVRVEEFVVRTGASSFAFVTLNGRAGRGLSYYQWSGAFGSPLPRNLESVFETLGGSVGAPAPWTLTDFTATRSNGVDSLVVRGSGGHQVDLNSNADPTDDVASIFDPATDSFASAVGKSAYKTLFDRYGVYSNGVLKSGWTGTNIQSQGDATIATTNDPFTGAAASVPTPDIQNATFPDSGSVRQRVYDSYGDGTFLSTDNRAVSPGGGVVSRAAFGAATSGPDFATGMLRSTLETTTNASEFSRSVDLVVSPRILVETGALK